MTHLHNEQDAIKQAACAGYRFPSGPTLTPDETIELAYPPEVVLDPKFWQTLGKARWNHEMKSMYDTPDWLHYALRYFETRLSNGDMQAFWQSLP
jgi:hypothetical protein